MLFRDKICTTNSVAIRGEFGYNIFKVRQISGRKTEHMEPTQANINTLYEIGEYAAAGFYEALAADFPFPRMYGLAYRRLYENMPVRVHETQILTPFEALYESRTGFGDSMNNGERSNDLNGAHHATAFILNPFHCEGLEISYPIIAEKKAKFPQYAAWIDELGADLKIHFPSRQQYVHSNPDMETVVRSGFNDYKKQIAAGISAAEAEQDSEGRNLLFALEDFAAGIDAYFQSTLKALTKAAEAATGEHRTKLAIVRDAFSACFYEPAETFLQGLLAVNFVWMLDGCDSIGRLDDVLGGLFEKDLACGKLDIAFARECLDDLWRTFDRMNGWNMQIGGATPNGGRCYNRLTNEILLCNARNKVRRPNLALRVTKDMPEEILDLALDSIAAGTGKPALYNDELYIQTLLEQFPELTKEDAACYSFGGCTETEIAGLSCCDSLGGNVNFAHCLQQVIFGSKHDEPRRTIADYDSFDELLQAVKACVAHKTASVARNGNKEAARRATQGDPKISRTMFTRDCIANRRSFEAGGARYNWTVVSYDGSTVLIDSLYAIKYLVYDTKQMTKETLFAALQADFVGYEDVQKLLMNAPKFGNDIAAVDDLGADFLRFAWGNMLDYPMVNGGRFVPSVILFATYENAGKGIKATANGRKADAPLNDSIGAFAGMDQNGPTALINSVLKLPHTLAVGTPVFNMRFSKTMATDPEGRAGIKNLIRTYFAGGGLQLQITVLSTEEMRAAQKEPEKYGDLIVRIGGYSEYFVYLSPALQESVMARAEYSC
jgi:formate C-acetyltransferase